MSTMSIKSIKPIKSIKSTSIKLTPSGRLFFEDSELVSTSGNSKLEKAFQKSSAEGLLYLASQKVPTDSSSPSIIFWKNFANKFLHALCHLTNSDDCNPQIMLNELAEIAEQAPPMTGIEYLNAGVLGNLWLELCAFAKNEISKTEGGIKKWLEKKNPLLHLVGRVTFHLAENKRNENYPFAFMATYTNKVSEDSKLQYLPLGKALEEYAGNRSALVSLLSPVRLASEKSEFVKKLVDSGEIYHPRAWPPQSAYQFLKEIPNFEEAGIIVRVPDWWKKKQPPKPKVEVTIGDTRKSKLGLKSMLDFSIKIVLDGEEISLSELKKISSADGLALFKGKWIEIDKEKLDVALKHWESLQNNYEDGVSLLEGMRLLSGANISGETVFIDEAETKEWSSITAGKWLEKILKQLREPANIKKRLPEKELKTKLRPYQKVGLNWLFFMYELGFGMCLADDMGLGKTIQVIALLLTLKKEFPGKNKKPALLVVPASLVSNWKSEIYKFAPSISIKIAHSSELSASELENFSKNAKRNLRGIDLVITTYSMVKRLDWIAEMSWENIILDEAQAIKNPGTKQTRAIKKLKTSARIVLTGTPIENKLSDLWSLFDFINPGLLGSAKEFADFSKKLSEREHNQFAPVRKLVRPYILRRLKTDKSIISDLPDKTEVQAYCRLAKVQAAHYQSSVEELARQLEAGEADGIKRRGLVLSFLMRFKQICNHPSQWLGDNNYQPENSGKFSRLSEICEEIASRQEKTLIFTQFREMTAPLNEFLKNIFGREGLVLHGGTPVKKRKNLVDEFQKEEGPPYFILSLKAGGTGLNLTAASHVIHFDRWWNPAVENQATDRAFRIGQKKNVLVHKFVCLGTIEERIDDMIEEKKSMADDILKGGAAKLLTEMNDKELIDFVSLDIKKV